MEPSSSLSIIMSVLIFLFLYTLFWVLSRRIRNSRLQPPEAGGAWPVIGHLHLLDGSEPTHKTLGDMADAYGPIFTLKLGMNKAVVVSNWEIAKECFTTNDKIFASRPKVEAAKLLGYNNSMFGLSPYGSYWRHMRKITILGLVTNRHLNRLQHILQSELQISIAKLYDLWANRTSNNQSTKAAAAALVEMNTWFGDLTLNTMFRMVVGKRFSSDLEGSNYRKEFRDFLNLFGVFVPSDSLPFLSWLDLGGYKKAMKKTAKVMDEMMEKWMKEHRQKKKKKKNSGEIMETKEEDFMDVLLSAVEDDEQLSGNHGDSIVKANCLSVLLAGSDATITTMVWAISLLLNNEESLKKVQLELEEKVGRQRQVRESDVKDLIYLQAIVKETLRLYPAAPLSAPHESTEDCNIFGYNIPAKTRLIVNLQKLQRDPFVWENPSEFRPERFLTSQKDLDVKGRDPQLIPFGSGRRICLGISFALQVISFTLANLIHGFEMGRPSKELLDMKESVGFTSVRKTPLEVALAPRLPPQVYK